MWIFAIQNIFCSLECQHLIDFIKSCILQWEAASQLIFSIRWMGSFHWSICTWKYLLSWWTIRIRSLLFVSEMTPGLLISWRDRQLALITVQFNSSTLSEMKSICSLNQMIPLHRKNHPVSQIFQTSLPNQHHCIHHPLHHQVNQMAHFCHYYWLIYLVWLCYLLLNCCTQHQLKNKLPRLVS